MMSFVAIGLGHQQLCTGSICSRACIQAWKIYMYAALSARGIDLRAQSVRVCNVQVDECPFYEPGPERKTGMLTLALLATAGFTIPVACGVSLANNGSANDVLTPSYSGRTLCNCPSSKYAGRDARLFGMPDACWAMPAPVPQCLLQRYSMHAPEAQFCRRCCGVLLQKDISRETTSSCVLR